MQGKKCSIWQFSEIIAMMLVLLSMVLPGQMALAAQVTDLYDAEIPVYSQSRADRHDAIKQAFAEVLVRVSGQQDVVLALPPLIETDAVPLKKTPNQQQPNLVLVGKTQEIASALDRATSYVKQFRYQKPTGRPHIDWGIKTAGDKKHDKPARQVIWLRFNKKKVNSLLHKAGLPVWGKTRPSVLVWMVIESHGKRYLLSNSIKSTTREKIEKHAKLYGLPIRFPLMDLADRANISTRDVWANFEDRIMEASRRYQTESILVGKLYLENRAWNTRWNLYVNGRRVEWTEQAGFIEKVVKQGLSHTAQNLAQAFADVITDKGIEHVLLKVNNIESLADYAQAIKYLSSLSAVKKVQPVKLEGDSGFFSLTTQGSRVGVMQSIALGSQLMAEPNTVPRQTPVISQPDNATDQQDSMVVDGSGIATAAKQPVAELVPDLVYRLLK